MAKTKEDYTKEYWVANAAGDAAGMKAANEGANSIRTSLGEATYDSSVGDAQRAATVSKLKAPAVNSSPDIGTQLKSLLGSNSGNYNSDIVGRVQDLFDQRTSKAMATPELNKYANDDLMTAAQTYLSAADNYQQTQDALTSMKDLINQKYQSPMQGDISSLTSGLMNKKDFSYDYKTDPAFQAYATKYGLLGDQAMADTLGDVAGMTGGIPSSYAVTAAAQAKNNYNGQITDSIPALMEAAYNKYQNGITNDMNLASTMSGVDANQYSQFSDNKNSAMDSAKYLADFGYNASRDTVSDSQYNKEFDYMATRDQIEDDQWMKQYTAEEQQRIISNAMDNKQINISEGNLALSKLKYSDDKNATETDTSYYGGMYQEMVGSGDPEGWLAENASALTKEELEWLKKNMPGASEDSGYFN